MHKMILLFSFLLVASFQKFYAQADTVKIVDYAFQPKTLIISPGKTVVWINTSQVQHTTTSGTNCTKDGKWNSDILDKGQAYSHTFDSAGTYNYFCIPHCMSGMAGVIEVKKKEEAGSEEDSKKKVGQQKKEKKYTDASFNGTDIINTPSAKVLDKGTLDFTLYHRFDDLIGARGGSQVLFGLDNIRDVRLALSYGLFKRITIGVARSKGDWFNAPYQEVKNLYDGNIKIRILNQDSISKSPVGISVFANTVYSAMKRDEMQGSEADFKNFTYRFSHCAQVILTHDFPKYLSVQLSPTYVRRNWVNTCNGANDELDLFALGGAARWTLTKRMGIIAEYFYVFSSYRKTHDDVYFNPLAIGFEVFTGGHVFHINLSNSTGIIPNAFIPYTTSSWTKNGFRLGFSISRKFGLKKKESKKRS